MQESQANRPGWVGEADLGLGLLATKAVPAGAVGVEDKETNPGHSVTMLGPRRQVPPSPHGLQILAKSPRPTAAQGLTHAAELAHACFPEVCAWGMGIPATHMSPSTKSLGWVIASG